MMTSTDPIADMLSRIRNALAVGKAEIELPHSSVKQSVAEVLAKAGFINSARVKEVEGRKVLQISLSQANTNSPLTHLKRISSPGRRIYAQAGAIPTVKRGRGIVVVSTSKGMMRGDEAKHQNLGGELVCEVY